MGHNATFGTHVWATRRSTMSQINILYISGDDTSIHSFTTQHLVHLCRKHRFPTPQRNMLYTCVGDTPIHKATTQHLVNVCGRHGDPLGHNATFGTHVWTTRRFTCHKSGFCLFPWTTSRFTGSRRNIWYPCVDDTPIHNVTIQHLVQVCGRHAHSPGHNSTFGTRVWTTVRLVAGVSIRVVSETRC